jgi:hypothetical protein
MAITKLKSLLESSQSGATKEQIEFAKGYRQAAKDAAEGLDVDLSRTSVQYRKGYKKGLWDLRYDRFNDKIVKALSFMGFSTRHGRFH